jgi:acetyl esterase/lipase
MNPTLLPDHHDQRGYHDLIKSSRKNFLLVLLLPAVTFLLSGSLVNAQQVAKVSPGGTSFLVYTPPGYNPTGTTTYPLLVCLHGGSEIGSDITKLQTMVHQMPSRLIHLNQWPANRPFIVLSPQLKRDTSIPNPNDQEWPAAYVDEVVQHVRATYKVDATRIYLTGISLGGHGCWTYAAAYPTKVAALVPISGKSDVTKACAVKSIPIWAFHGESDGLVKPQFSIDMINAINACQPAGLYKPKLNLLYSRIHEGWNEIYTLTNGYDVFTWLMKFKKNVNTNKTPYVNAGIDQKLLLRSTSLHVAGDYFDSDGTISTVTWTKTLGPAVTMANTNTKFLKLTGLQAGIYEFQLAVKDNAGATSTDRVKVEIVSTSTNPAVTGLVLMNGKTNVDIGNISEGQVINKSTLGITEINIRAIAGTGTASVRFRVNADQNTRTLNQPGPYLIRKQSTTPEWDIKNGDYVICATPYTQSAGKGVAGISQCFKITVTGGAAPLAREATADEPLEQVLSDLSPSSDKLHVYPNPASDYLQVKGGEPETLTRYTIVNPQGVEVQRGDVTSGNDIRIQRPLPKGVYILKLSGDKQAPQSIRFVID